MDTNFLNILSKKMFESLARLFKKPNLFTATPSKKKSVYLINQSFYPDEDATGQMMTDLAEDLVTAGLNVTVITGNRYGNNKESYHGINVRRVNCLKLNKKILFFRYLNYLSFIPLAFFEAILLPKPNVFFVVSSPPFMYFIGWALKILKRSKLILNVQDLYPDIAVKLGLLKNRSLTKIISRLTLKAYYSADLIICIGETMQSYLLARGVPPEKLFLIHNWADGQCLYPLPREVNDDFIIQYSGNIGLVHEIDTVLSAAELLQNETHIRFDFIGDGVQAEKIRTANLPNIRLSHFRPRAELNASLNNCTTALVTMKAGFGGTIVPSKLYGILATGKPVIAICPSNSEITNIVRNNNCGVVVDPGDVGGLVKAIISFKQNKPLTKSMGENARTTFLARFNRPIGTQTYFAAVWQLIK